MFKNLFSADFLVDVDASTFSFGVITVCALCLLVLLANMLRRKIRFLRRSLLPTAVIAGLIGLAIKEIVLYSVGIELFDEATLEGLVYHSLSLGFIALCLRDKEEVVYDVNSIDKKYRRTNAFKVGGHIVSCYLIQALVGVAVTVFLAFTFIPELNMAAGFILPLGFGQGSGQAAATGGIWDAMGIFDAFGGGNIGVKYGLTVAAFGFLFASIPGIFIINSIAKRRGISLSANDYQKSGDLPPVVVEEPDEIPLSESIDKFSIQVCLVGAVYLITIGFIVLVEVLFRLSGLEFLINLVPTFWGFSFMIGVMFSLITKAIIKKLHKKNIISRKYTNNFMLNRISGATFDISVTAAFCIISIAALGKLWIPTIIMSAFGGLVTFFFCRFLCKKISPDYADEAFVSMYGMMTGTIGSGIILLREIDPTFVTPAADDLVAGSTTGIIFGFPLLLLIAQAPRGNNIWWVTIVVALYLVALVGYQLDWHKKIFKRKSKADK